MAIVDPTLEEVITRGDHGQVVTWGPLGTGDYGKPISMIGYTRRTIQVLGGVSPTDRLTIEGSNNGTDYVTLTDIHGNALNFRSAGLSTLADLTLWIRPRVVSGDPGATVIMLMRKTEAR